MFTIVTLDLIDDSAFIFYGRRIFRVYQLLSDGVKWLNRDVGVELPATYTSLLSCDVCQLASRDKVLPPVTSEEGSEMESKAHA
jgi:hypothetical protein